MRNADKTQDERALERFKIISPILSALETKADAAKIGVLKREACGEAGISRKTLARWLNRYAQKGFDGLKYRGGTTTEQRIISDTLLDEAILLRREVPSRSVPQIIEILELEGKVAPGFLKRTTLQDRLREKGYSAVQMKYYAQPGLASRRFARRERNRDRKIPARATLHARVFAAIFAAKIMRTVAVGHKVRPAHQNQRRIEASILRRVRSAFSVV